VVPDPELGSQQWWDERRQRLLRRRPRAEGLTIERIVEAALHVVDTEGLDELTVRRLADTLSTGSASLYRHVASRDELLVLVVDHVLGEIVLPSAALDPRAKVEWLSAELRRVLIAHPNLLPALTAAPLIGPNAVRGAQNGLCNMLEAGYPAAAAVPAYLAMIDFVLGTVYFDTSRAGQFTVEAVSHGDSHIRPTADDVFTFGLTTLLDGLASRFPG
jgi:AcrR family transcriptional regulator